MAIMSTGQITLVDLTDERSSSFYLQGNQPKIQIKNSDDNSYSPDYSTAAGIVIITPKLFFGNDDCSNLIGYSDTIDNIVYKVNGNAVTGSTRIKKGGNAPSGDVSYYQLGESLYIQKNIDVIEANKKYLNIEAEIPKNTVTDPDTGVTNGSSFSATLEFSLISTGKTGVDGTSIASITQYYASNDSNSTPPTGYDSTPVSTNWKTAFSDVAALAANNRYLWSFSYTTYTKGNPTRSTPVVIGTYGSPGATGRGIASIVEEYYVSTSKTTQTGGSWSTTAPTWEKGKYVWTRSLITYTSGSPATSTTTPICDTTWESVTDAITGYDTQIGAFSTALDALQKQIDDTVETWFYDGVPSSSTEPEKNWSNNKTKTAHVGDLYYDNKTGLAYRYTGSNYSETTKEYSSFAWSVVEDNAVAVALKTAQDAQAAADNKVTIYYTATVPTAASEGDLWIPGTDKDFKRCTADYNADATNKDNYWVLANQNIGAIDVEYISKPIGQTPTDSDTWSTTSPTWKDGERIWQRTKTTDRSGTVIATSNPVCISAAAARSIELTGEQVFLVNANVIPEVITPASITLTATCYGDLTVGKWYYKTSGGVWSQLSNTGSTYTVSPTSAAIWNNDIAVIKVEAAEGTSYFDVFSIHKVTNGKNGTNGLNGTNGSNGKDGTSVYMGFLDNEAQIFDGTTNQAIADRTATTKLYGFYGTENKTVTIKTIGGIIAKTSNMTIVPGLYAKVSSVAAAMNPTITFTTTNGLTSSGQIPITYGITGSDETYTTYFSYSIAFTGAAGNGIKDVISYYELNNNKDSAPGIILDQNTYTQTNGMYLDTTKLWSNVPGQPTADKQYLWESKLVIYEDGTMSAGNPVIIAVYAPPGKDGVSIQALVMATEGREHFTDANPADITLSATLYVNGAAQTANVTYTWSSVPASSSITGGGATKVIKRDYITNIATIVCTIRYDGKDYKDYIVLYDKTDPIYSVITSSQGDKFINGNISTVLTCNLYDGKGQITDVSGYVFTWTKIDKDKNEQNWYGTTSKTKTGQVINIDANQVDYKCTFTCVVTKA